MKVEIKETGQNERQIEMTLERADFAPELNKRLKEMRNKTDIKGFRKGKTPMSFVRRNYGKQVALEVITQKTNEALSAAITDNKLEMINEPILLKSKVPAIEDGGLEDDCQFTYVIGLMPELELNGLSSTDTYTYYELDVDAEKIDERLEAMQKQMGEHIHPDDIEEHDVVEIEAIELEGEQAKEDGVTTTFRFAVDLIANEDLKKTVLAAKSGDTFDFDINQIEKDRPKEYIKEYFLKLDKDSDQTFGDHFRGTIQSIHRQVPAELNEAFFEKAFPADVTSVEQAKEEIRKQYIKGYAPVGDNLFLKDLIDQLESNNDFELPETYIHELLHQSGRHQHGEEELASFKESVKRQILISMVMKKLDIKVTQDDMRKKVMEEFTANFGGMTLPPETIDRIVSNAMQDQKYVNELSDRVLNDKLIVSSKEQVTLDIVTEKEEALMKRYDAAFPKKSDEEE